MNLRFLRQFLSILLILWSFPCWGALRWTIEIPVQEGAQVTAHMDGRTIPLGTVESIPTSSRHPSYTASAWGTPGHCCASAVNALHFLVSVENKKGRTISVIPSDTIAPAATPGTAVVIRGKGGLGLFGTWAPPVGTPVMIRSLNGFQEILGPSRLPVRGDTMVLAVNVPSPPIMVDIENRPSGQVTLWTARGPRIIAHVVRPVRGTGRFGGTLYQSVGRMRANHPGVIDISTSRYGHIGGFQIVPLQHGKSPEMASMWSMTQWMILAPESDTPLAGHWPLFSEAMIPGPTQPQDESARGLSLWARYGRRSLVLCRMDSGPWQWLPQVEGRNDLGLQSITHLRIYFPNDAEPLSSRDQAY
ncbi:MAG: hypothetical protein CSA35_07560 [Dethiosulfovibrio peptidovorans]|nr:MAG: hypothetical protein CSA35_07560 [Dethiosulfovibrio peptidovorans]